MAGTTMTTNVASDTEISIGVRIPGHAGILLPGPTHHPEVTRHRGVAMMVTHKMSRTTDGTASRQRDMRTDGIFIELRRGQKRSISIQDRYHPATMVQTTETTTRIPMVTTAQLLRVSLLQKLEHKSWPRCKQMPWITLRHALPRSKSEGNKMKRDWRRRTEYANSEERSAIRKATMFDNRSSTLWVAEWISRMCWVEGEGRGCCAKTCKFDAFSLYHSGHGHIQSLAIAM